MTVSLVHGGEWGLYNSAFDPALGALAPGMVLVGELIEQAAEEGCRSSTCCAATRPTSTASAPRTALERLTIVRADVTCCRPRPR
jgi:hypothetical protein